MPTSNSLTLATLLSLVLSCSASSAQICGDADGDGLVTILDALLAAQISAGVLVPTPSQLVLCDVDSSGAVTITDALLIAQAASGLPVVLACPGGAGLAQWTRSFGGTDGDWLRDATSEGNVIYAAGTKDRRLAATIESAGWVVARNADGSMLWETTLVDTSARQLELTAIASAPGFLYAGGFLRTWSGGAYDDDIVVVTLDLGGNVLDQWLIIDATTQDGVHGITVARDGSLLVVGNRLDPGTGDMDAWVLNLTVAGSIRWQTKLATTGADFLASAAADLGTGYYLSGQVGVPGSPSWGGDGWLVAIDAGGTALWQRRYAPGGPGNSLLDLAVDPAGVWLVGETCDTCFAESESWLVRTDLAGNLVSSTQHGNGAGLGADSFHEVILLPGGQGLVVAGSTHGAAISQEAFGTLHQFDPIGTLLWARRFGPATGTTVCHGAARLTEGTIAFAGSRRVPGAPSGTDAFVGKMVPSSTALDTCASTNLLNDPAVDLTPGTTDTVPATVVQTTTAATLVPAPLTLDPASTTPVDVVHCTN